MHELGISVFSANVYPGEHRVHFPELLFSVQVTQEL